MIKRFALTLALGLSSALALAALPQAGADAAKAATLKTSSMTGTITAIKGIRVDVEVAGEKPAWVKKGAALKLPDIKGGLGKVIDVTPTGIAFNTKKASELKVGGKVTLEKGTAVPSGC